MPLQSKKGYGRKGHRRRGIFRRDIKRCEICRRKIKSGRYCYYCGKYKGLW